MLWTGLPKSESRCGKGLSWTRRKAKSPSPNKPPRGSKTPRIRPVRASTLARQEIAVRKYLVPYFGRMAVADIDYEAVRWFLASLQKSGLTPATQSKYLNILKRILDEALKSKAIQYNPVSLVAGPGSKATRKSRFLEPEEVNIRRTKEINFRLRRFTNLLGGFAAFRE